VIRIIKISFADIILADGNTVFNSFADRMRKEINEFALICMKIKVIDHPERKFTAWIRGSILSSINEFQSSWITK